VPSTLPPLDPEPPLEPELPLDPELLLDPLAPLLDPEELPLPPELELLPVLDPDEPEPLLDPLPELPPPDPEPLPELAPSSPPSTGVTGAIAPPHPCAAAAPRSAAAHAKEAKPVAFMRPLLYGVRSAVWPPSLVNLRCPGMAFDTESPPRVLASRMAVAARPQSSSAVSHPSQAATPMETCCEMYTRLRRQGGVVQTGSGD
jgi:hypothetical protein